MPAMASTLAVRGAGRIALAKRLQTVCPMMARHCASTSNHGSKGEDFPVTTMVTGVTVAAITGVAAWITYQQKEIAYKETAAYKIDVAANKIAQQFVAIPGDGTQVVERAGEAKKMKDRIAAPMDKQTTVVVGQFMAGKTTLIEDILEKEIGKGIVKFTLTTVDWEQKMYNGLLGDIARKETFKMALAEAEAKMVGQKPIVLLDIPRHSSAKIGEVSTWCKDMTEGGFAKVVVVASQLEMALGFDAGGKERQYSIHINNLTDEEARNLLERNYPNLEKEQIQQMVASVGTNPGVLKGIATNVERKGMTMQNALSLRREACMMEMRALRALIVQDPEGKFHKVGREIVDQLLKQDMVKHATWQDKGLTVKDVAKTIKEKDAYAITYHFEHGYWYFASPMHKEVAKVATQ